LDPLPTRVDALLDRWQAGDVSGEPEWNVEALQPLALRAVAN
jgi:hypothetical protein